MAKETDLYAPVKELLEARGYRVKAEVNSCDVVACKDAAPVVIVELKLAFSLDLVLQGITRQSLTDDVYLAVQAPDTATKRRNWRGRQRGYIKLCRMLGLGLMLVDPNPAHGRNATTLLDPAPYAPRKNKRRQTRLLTEFLAREGDPNTGGASRKKIITAYRQDALRVAVVLSRRKTMKVAEIRAAAGVHNAASILQKNHYDWFERTERGIYCLSPAGREGLRIHAEVLPSLADDPP
ncbi:MAG: DUF2161 family putative PD-(D/E)XK-type phosphodiesterase [Alphaproteobacteria bacterium]|jgi:hypothetical protein|nr:DUF2161 family putative PD-(D/E)XK-type phosphodiesterase [Alphaproteobacteria bacterium]